MLWKARSPAPAVPITARLPRPQGEGREGPGAEQRRRATSSPDTEAHTTSTELDTCSQHYLIAQLSTTYTYSTTSRHLATSTLLSPLDTQAVVASATPTQYRELVCSQGSSNHCRVGSVTLDLGLAGLEHEGRFAHEDHPRHHEAGRPELDDVELVPEQRGGEQDRHLDTN